MKWDHRNRIHGELIETEADRRNEIPMSAKREEARREAAKWAREHPERHEKMLKIMRGS